LRAAPHRPPLFPYTTLFRSIKRLASANNNIQQALAAAERVFAVLDVETEAATDTGVRGLDGVQSSMELRGVSYRYDGVETWALRDRKSTRLNSSHLVISYAV